MPRQASATSTSHYADPQHRTVRYETVSKCPLCAALGEKISELTRGTYRFGDFTVDYPDDGSTHIALMECPRCKLMFKELIPHRDDLAALFTEVAGTVWMDRRGDHSAEQEWVERAQGRTLVLDLLDIGSADGGLLGAFSDRPGRRSALDVVEDPECRAKIHGEYILALLEGDFEWSGKPYQIVTGFDVLEHLYDPIQAFENLAHLVAPGGHLIIQTGDRECAPADPATWWYANLLEHHIFWNETSIRYATARFGFCIDTMERTQQKDRARTSLPLRVAIDLLRRGARSDALARVESRILGRDARDLADPWAKDHLTCILRRPS